MATLTRWDPYREMVNFRKVVNRMLEDPFYTQGPDWDQSMSWDLPLDVVEKPDEYIIKASLPGINPDDLDITYNNNMLTIRGEMKSDSEHKEGDYLLQERRFGSFQRTVSLPETIKDTDIEAHYHDGVLTLTLPKTEEVKPKRIAIKSGSSKKVIEAHASSSDGNQK
ncbi:MAG: Hsp20/alpha crystallin family protein [Anaerolineaceae bacterium]|nr:Hsp20/alpha crystallin family protein [Anaerolineaceae bacterium]